MGQPGDLTIIDDPIKKLKYFKAANEGGTGGGGQEGLIDVQNESDFNELVSSGVTVVDYWAPWCRYCKKVNPVLSKLATEYPSTKFVKVNTTELDDLASRYEVDALPTLQFFKDGQKVSEYKGSDLSGIEKAIRAAA